MRDTTHMIVENQAIYDSIKNAADSLNRIISDNITIEALQKSQEFYNTSFLNLQNSFSNFIVGVSIVSAILAAITTVLVVFNFMSANKLRKESKEELEKVKKFEKEFEKQKNEFEEIKKQFETQKKELQDKIKELTATQESSLYHFLKGKFPSRSNVYMEINIKSKMFEKTENGRKEYKFKYCKITDSFDEKIFKIAISNLTLLIPYSKVVEWWPDDMQPDRKINLELNKAIVLYENEKLELEDL
ncbi:MAG: hypothetical protein LBQ76_08010 [Candidatus Fibromonas sp.]|jgi:uncharacterized membrane protein|nr:hypothetical protein [Candidatus Fibromonas sp.]